MLRVKKWGDGHYDNEWTHSAVNCQTAVIIIVVILQHWTDDLDFNIQFSDTFQKGSLLRK